MYYYGVNFVTTLQWPKHEHGDDATTTHSLLCRRFDRCRLASVWRAHEHRECSARTTRQTAGMFLLCENSAAILFATNNGNGQSKERTQQLTPWQQTVGGG